MLWIALKGVLNVFRRKPSLGAPDLRMQNFKQVSIVLVKAFNKIVYIVRTDKPYVPSLAMMQFTDRKRPFTDCMPFFSPYGS